MHMPAKQSPCSHAGAASPLHDLSTGTGIGTGTEPRKGAGCGFEFCRNNHVTRTHPKPIHPISAVPRLILITL